jgi:hypothetical protein
MEEENINQIAEPTLEETQPKTYYRPSVKKAIMIYRAKNIDKYNEFQRQYYHTKKGDDEWKGKFNDRCKEANRKYREKKRLENPPLPRGRPRKTLVVLVE